MGIAWIGAATGAAATFVAKDVEVLIIPLLVIAILGPGGVPGVSNFAAPWYTMSTLRSFSQIPVRTKLLITTTGPSFGYYDAALTENLPTAPVPYTYEGSIIETMSYADMLVLYRVVYDSNFTPAMPAGTLLKDLGKRVQFMFGGLLYIEWTLVQRMNGSASEGVGNIATDVFYVPTYVADQISGDALEVVTVARLG